MITNNNTNAFVDVHHFVNGLPYESKTTSGGWTIYNLRNGKHIAKYYVYQSGLTISTSARVNGYYITTPVQVTPPSGITDVYHYINGGVMSGGAGWAIFFGYKGTNGNFFLTAGRRDATAASQLIITAEIVVQDFFF